jgi:hypothetical protein
MILALLLLVVELVDFYFWSGECYHRRLTMTVYKEVDPPLYPIPGQCRESRSKAAGTAFE